MFYLTVLLSIFSCSTIDNSLEDRKWYLTEIEGDNNIIVINEKNPFIEFDFESSKISGNTSCNNFFMDYTIDNNNIHFGPIATTKMACPDVIDQEYRFLNALERIDSLEISNNVLFLYENEIPILKFKITK